jgi:hypothetical protein
MYYKAKRKLRFPVRISEHSSKIGFLSCLWLVKHVTGYYSEFRMFINSYSYDIHSSTANIMTVIINKRKYPIADGNRATFLIQL